MAQAKYKNKKTVVDGIVFHSMREAKRYSDLKLMQRAGLISGLALQVPYQLIVNGVKICAYNADFTYTDQTGFIVEDSKGYRTKDYIIKRKLMLACHGIKILET